MKVGLKLVREDFGSLTSGHGRVIYPRDEWVDVPGNGAYVAMTGGLLSAGYGPKCIYIECDGSEYVPDVHGVVCYSRVRHIAPCLELLSPELQRIVGIWDEPPDQALLADIAKTDQDCDVRRAATERLTDQALLADIAKTDESWDVRRAATERLTDQAPLADIAKTDQDCDVRRAATERLTVLRGKA